MSCTSLLVLNQHHFPEWAFAEYLHKLKIFDRHLRRWFEIFIPYVYSICVDTIEVGKLTEIVISVDSRRLILRLLYNWLRALSIGFNFLSLTNLIPVATISHVI
jgi:hypothetical protein